VVGVAAFRERRQPIAYQPAPMIGAMEKSAADSSAGASAGRAESSAPSVMAQQLGTGHGQRRYDPVTRTEFERDSTRPNQRIALYYDSVDALVARGILHDRGYGRQPDPFPVGFVPDPR